MLNKSTLIKETVPAYLAPIQCFVITFKNLPKEEQETVLMLEQVLKDVTQNSFKNARLLMVVMH